MPAALVSIALLGEPIGSSILAWLFLKEIPSWVEIIGGGLILLGIIFSTKGMTSAS
jgi:drug/metabolite transporter (DMT)-like permease